MVAELRCSPAIAPREERIGSCYGALALSAGISEFALNLVHRRNGPLDVAWVTQPHASSPLLHPPQRTRLQPIGRSVARLTDSATSAVQAWPAHSPQPEAAWRSTVSSLLQPGVSPSASVPLLPASIPLPLALADHLFISLLHYISH